MEAIVLPEVKLFKQDKANKHYCWSDHYGALKVASDYTGVNILLDSPHKYFCWHHGCHGPWENVHPGILTYNFPKRDFRYFVGTKDQELYLKEHGYANAKAIGLPIAYVRKPSLPRLRKSLLIAPSHSLRGQKDFDKGAVDDYTKFIAAHIPHFDRVAACVHHSCIENGLWIKEFRSLGIEIIIGARTDDENALSRQLHIYSQFETITTNNWGSHVAYALYCGCRVSICGPYYEKSYADALRDGTWSRNEDALKLFRSEEVISNKTAYLARFRSLPTTAIGDVALGEYLVGLENKISPSEMACLFKAPVLSAVFYSIAKLFKKPLGKVYRSVFKKQ